MQAQGAFLGHRWQLLTHTTFSFIGESYEPQDAIIFLLTMRKKINDRIRKKTKYFSAIGLGLENNLPHFHILIDDIGHSELKKFIPKGVKCCIHKQLIRTPYDENIKNVIGYLIEQNFFYVQKYKPRQKSLITASKGFRTGKPYTLDHLVRFL